MSGSLANSPAEIIKTLLIARSFGGLTAGAAVNTWPITVAATPDTPDNQITITNSSGKIEGRFHTSGEMQEHYGFQTKVRALDYNTGWAKVNAIKQFYDTGVVQAAVAIGSASYVVYAITRSGGIMDMGWDVGTTKRRLFSLNAIVAIRQTN